MTHEPNSRATQSPEATPVSLADPHADVLAQIERDLQTTMALLVQSQATAEEASARCDVLTNRRSDILAARSALANLPDLAPEHEWLNNLTRWRAALCEELLALPVRIRSDHDLGRQRNLKLSIGAIDRGLDTVDGSGYRLETLRLGRLMREAGYVEAPPADGEMLGHLPWYGSTPEVEQRIQQINRTRAEAEARLAHALLDDAERERRAADDKARREAERAAPRRKTRADGSQYDRYPDGRVVEITS